MHFTVRSRPMPTFFLRFFAIISVSSKQSYYLLLTFERILRRQLTADALIDDAVYIPNTNKVNESRRYSIQQT